MTKEEIDDPLVPPASGFIGAIIRYKRLLFFAGLLWFGFVLGGGLYLSTIDARTGLHVFGSNVWVTGHTSALRVSLRDLRLSMNRPLDEVQVKFVDVNGVEGPTYLLKEKAQGFVQGAIQAPDRAGRWSIHFRAFNEGTPLTARLGVDVRPRRVATQTVLRSAGAPRKTEARSTRVENESGPVTFHIEPLDGVIPSGLPGHLILLARRGDAPTAAEVKIKVSEGRSDPPVARSVSVPDTGFTLLPVRAVHPVFQFDLSTTGSKAQRRLHPVSTQFSLETPSSVVSPGLVEMDVRSLHQRGEIFVDLWRGDHWISTTTASLKEGWAKVRVKVPRSPDAQDLFWVQVYRHAYMPGTARDGRYILVTEGERAQAVAWFSQHIMGIINTETAPNQANDRLIFESIARADTAETNSVRALLGRIPRPTHSPPLLADSGETVIQTVSDLKSTWQVRFVIALILSGLVMFLIVGLLLYQNQRDVEQGWALAGGADDGDRGTRKRLALEAGYLFLVLAVFLLGMIQLMLAIRW